MPQSLPVQLPLSLLAALAQPQGGAVTISSSHPSLGRGALPCGKPLRGTPSPFQGALTVV